MPFAHVATTHTSTLRDCHDDVGDESNIRPSLTVHMYGNELTTPHTRKSSSIQPRHVAVVVVVVVGTPADLVQQRNELSTVKQTRPHTHQTLNTIVLIHFRPALDNVVVVVADSLLDLVATSTPLNAAHSGPPPNFSQLFKVVRTFRSQLYT